jgi:hypothetical protein
MPETKGCRKVRRPIFARLSQTLSDMRPAAVVPQSMPTRTIPDAT